ncbi:DUF983 domain-containing protein [Flavobacteriaceae bacterium]|nr:DUF983 domain-containing protein [Flavobacteriaceae bacterium]
MIKKGQKLYSIIHNKCPKCQEGNFFEYPLTLNFNKILKNPDHCSVCGQKFNLEPSFYYGAMYVSYAITVALAIGIFIICYALGIGLLKTFIGIVIALILTTPIVLRLARIIWINFFISYDEQSDQ